MSRGTPSGISVLKLAARLAEIFPMGSVRSGLPMAKLQYHTLARGGRPTYPYAKSRLTLASWYPPPGPVPSSSMVVTNGKYDEGKSGKVKLTAGLGVGVSVS